MARRNRNLLLFFLLIALAVTAVRFWLRGPSLVPSSQGGEFETFEGCGMEGDASSEPVRELNRLKNRYEAPEDAEIDPRVTLEAMLTPGADRARWDERRGAEITGYVWDVKTGGVETVNCHANDPEARDTHIELVLDPMNGDERRRVIVEVTPRWRAIMAQRGEDWSRDAIRGEFQGRWVRVRGWLLFDFEHGSQSVNTAAAGGRGWRATAWEIHPVTSLEVISRPR